MLHFLMTFSIIKKKKLIAQVDMGRFLSFVSTFNRNIQTCTQICSTIKSRYLSHLGTSFQAFIFQSRLPLLLCNAYIDALPPLLEISHAHGCIFCHKIKMKEFDINSLHQITSRAHPTEQLSLDNQTIDRSMHGLSFLSAQSMPVTQPRNNNADLVFQDTRQGIQLGGLSAALAHKG